MTSVPQMIFGAGGHAKSVYDSLSPSAQVNLVGFTSNAISAKDELFGHAVWPEEMALESLVRRKVVSKGIVAIGNNEARARLVDKILGINNNFDFISVVHPLSRISGSSFVARGAFVGAFASVGPLASLAEFTILNTSANLEHDAYVGRFSSVSPGVQLGGYSKIGSFSLVGMNASVLQGVCVGDHAIVGAGSVIARDVPAFQVIFGPKAEPKRQRAPGDPHL